MNKRLGFALAAYLALWAAVTAGLIYGIVLAGYSAWIGVASGFVLFLCVNGSLAHRARVRQFRLEGKEPPSYLQFLFLRRGFPKFKEEAPRFDHFLVGMAAALTGLFFVFLGLGLAFGSDWSRVSQPILLGSVSVILAAIGAVFLYLAWRMVAFSFRPKPPTNVA